MEYIEDVEIAISALKKLKNSIMSSSIIAKNHLPCAHGRLKTVSNTEPASTSMESVGETDA